MSTRGVLSQDLLHGYLMSVQTQIAFSRLAPMHKMPGACTLYVPLASLRLDVSDVEPAYRFHHPSPQISEQHICKHKTVAGHRQIPFMPTHTLPCKRML